jgi:hypothetical protein
MLKSIGIVLGSYALSIVLVLATDPLLTRIFPGNFERGRIPTTTPLVCSTTFFVAISILCAWLCAKLCARFDPGRPARHVLWFFILGEVMGIVSVIPNWSKGWPHWYWLAWLFTWPISCWIGLRISGNRINQPAAVASSV